jgi:N-carbamoyl-L-amino-acid hydrolase
MSAITPSAVLFVPSVGGTSHNPREFTRQEDIVNGANTLLHTLLGLMAEIELP